MEPAQPRSSSLVEHDSGWLARWLPYIALVLAFICYARALNYQFVADDNVQCRNNLHISDWHYIPVYFTEHIWSQVGVHSLGNYYRPVFLLWFFVNRQLWHDNLIGWHMTTLALHLLVSWFIFCIGRRVLGSRLAGGIACLVFALYPIHLESAAYISGVSDPLVWAFVMGAFLCHIRWRESKQAKFQYWSWVLFLFGAFAKESAFLFPAIVICYDWLYTRERAADRLTQLKNLLPAVMVFVAIEAFYIVCRYFALGALSYTLSPLSASTQLFTIPSVLWFYLRHLVWPFGLSLYYDTFYILRPDWDLFWRPVAYLFACIAFFALVALRSPRRRELAFAALCIALPLAPALNFTGFLWREIAHDRYLYLSTMGFGFVIALALIGAARWCAVRFHISGQSTIVVLLLLSTGWMVYGLESQMPQWHDNVALMEKSLENAPNNFSVLYSLGGFYMERHEYKKALDMHLRATRIAPQHWEAHYNTGVLLLADGQPEEAAKMLQYSIALDQGRDAREHYYLGEAQMQLKQYTDAEVSFRAAAEHDLGSVDSRARLGDALAALGRLKEAREAYQDALLLDPNSQAAQQGIAALTKKKS